jgi:negative regulator of flagellin synthesis FlgM
MDPINRVNTPSSVAKVASTPTAPRADQPAANEAPARGADRVELSGVQNLLQTLKANDIRTDKVASIRQQIESGSYETPDKLDIAADRLLDDLQ